MFIIKFINFRKQNQQTKKMDTHFFVSFRLLYYSFKRKFCTNRLNNGFRLNARIPPSGTIKAEKSGVIKMSIYTQKRLLE